MDVLLVLLMFSALHLAYVTYRAGLPHFAIAMAVTALIGYPMILAGHVIGLVFLLFSAVLAACSHSIMKEYHLGPFAHHNGRR